MITCSEILTTLGLGLDIIGVILLFIFAVDKTIGDIGAGHNTMSKIGLILLMLGFILQAISVWL